MRGIYLLRKCADKNINIFMCNLKSISLRVFGLKHAQVRLTSCQNKILFCNEETKWVE